MHVYILKIFTCVFSNLSIYLIYKHCIFFLNILMHVFVCGLKMRNGLLQHGEMIKDKVIM